MTFTNKASLNLLLGLLYCTVLLKLEAVKLESLGDVEYPEADNKKDIGYSRRLIIFNGKKENLEHMHEK